MCCPCEEEKPYCFLFEAQGYLRWPAEVKVLKNLVEGISEEQKSFWNHVGVSGVVPIAGHGKVCQGCPKILSKNAFKILHMYS